MYFRGSFGDILLKNKCPQGKIKIHKNFVSIFQYGVQSSYFRWLQLLGHCWPVTGGPTSIASSGPIVVFGGKFADGGPSTACYLGWYGMVLSLTIVHLKLPQLYAQALYIHVYFLSIIIKITQNNICTNYINCETSHN